MEIAGGVDLIHDVIANAPQARAHEVKSWLKAMSPERGSSRETAAKAFEVSVGAVEAGPVAREQRASGAVGDAAVVDDPAQASVAGQTSKTASHSLSTWPVPLAAGSGEGLRVRGSIQSQGGLARGEQQLRAFVMQMMIEEMLPDDVVGLGDKSDFASGIWRSMMAEKLALELGSAIDLDVLKSKDGSQSAKAAHAPVPDGASGIEGSEV